MVDLEDTGIKSPREESNDTKSSVLGRVTQVYTRTTTDDSGPDAFSNHEARVLLRTEDREHRRIPIHHSFGSSASLPKVGDFVRVEYLHGRADRPYVAGFAYNDQDARPPIAEAGHWRHNFGDLYVEAERTDHGEINDNNDYDVVRLAKKPDGLSDPTTQVAIDDSGGTVQVKIETDGDITLSAGGDIVIDEGGSTSSVAKQSHTHDYDDDDGTSTTTKTTSTPNESGTNVELE